MVSLQAATVYRHARRGLASRHQGLYNTVSASYADQVRNLLDNAPYERAALTLFAELVHAGSEGPVADGGCGPGRITAHLHELGVETFGIDLSPAMIDIARRDHPRLRFDVGSMTELDLADASLGGLIAWYSLVHVPDDQVKLVLANFRRVLRPGALLLLAFHVGDGSRLKTHGYGDLPMKVYVHLRQPDQVITWLRDAGFTVEAHMVVSSSPESALGGIIFAHRDS